MAAPAIAHSDVQILCDFTVAAPMKSTRTSQSASASKPFQGPRAVQAGSTVSHVSSTTEMPEMGSVASVGSSIERHGGAAVAGRLSSAHVEGRSTMRRRSVPFALFALFASLVVPALTASGSAREEPPVLASASDAGVKGNAGGSFPDLAASGRAIAFLSTSTNLDPGDTDSVTDVYVKDLASGDLILASTSDSGAKANALSTSPAMSGDGGFVAFLSNATNLDPGDTDSTLGHLREGPRHRRRRPGVDVERGRQGRRELLRSGYSREVASGSRSSPSRRTSTPSRSTCRRTCT